MSNTEKDKKSNKEMWGCIGAISAALITGICALIIALPTLIVFFQGLFTGGSTVNPPSNSISTPRPQITSNPSLDNFCPPTYGYGYAVSDGDFKPEMVIVGPATLHPLQGSYELGKVLGFDSVSRWGINIPTGQSVTIPSSVTLLSGKSYAPEGFYEVYASENDIFIVQQRWLENCP